MAQRTRCRDRVIYRGRCCFGHSEMMMDPMTKFMIKVQMLASILFEQAVSLLRPSLNLRAFQRSAQRPRGHAGQRYSLQEAIVSRPPDYGEAPGMSRATTSQSTVLGWAKIQGGRKAVVGVRQSKSNAVAPQKSHRIPISCRCRRLVRFSELS